MRKIIPIALLLALLLQPIAGQAQANSTIGELRESVPERWTQTYETKWRTIDIDVQPMVPDVDTFPVLTVSFDFWEPTISNLGDGWVDNGSPEHFIFDLSCGDSLADSESLTEKLKDCKLTSEVINAPLEVNRAYLFGNTLTLGEALAYAQEILPKAGLDYQNSGLSQLTYIEPVQWVDAKGAPIPMAGYYSFSSHQYLYGIPFLGHARDGFDRYIDEVPSTSPQLRFRMRTKESVEFFGRLVKETGLLAEDVPLCDFSIIKSAIEKEITNGHVRRIFDIELGYVLYNTPGITIKPGLEWMKTCEYYAVPAWRVNCLYVGEPKKELRDYTGKDVPERGVKEYGALIIDAQTGEALDRESNKKRMGDYTGYISWDDVGGKR